MKIKFLFGSKSAQEAVGLTVIIDVFRAFSTECYVFNKGAKRIIPIDSVSEAFALRKQNPKYLLMGEDHGKIPEGFNYGNSPLEIEDVDFTNKIVIHTTTNGTKGIMNARDSDEIITGSFVNIAAIISYIKNKNPKTVSLVCTGSDSEHVMNEDYWCAKYIEQKLFENNTLDFDKIRSQIIGDGHANHFFEDSVLSHPKEDFEYCMVLDKFSFVLKVIKSRTPYIEKIEV